MKKTDFILVLFILVLVVTGLSIYLGFNSESVSAATQTSVKDARDTVQLPILMYHGITDDPALINDYFISDKTFENDLKWLKEQGYTTVSMAQLIDYTEKGAKLPAKPVLLTFDDGYCNNYTVAFPLMKKYNAKGIISVIGTESNVSSDDIYRSPQHCNVSWGEIAILEDSDLIEIGDHTYDLHNTKGPRKGADRRAGESMENYRIALIDDLTKNRELIFNSTGSYPVVFAWPFGAYPTDGSANPILKELGYKATLTSYQKMNTIKKGEPDSLFNLKRFLRTPGFSMEKINSEG